MWTSTLSTSLTPWAVALLIVAAVVAAVVMAAAVVAKEEVDRAVAARAAAEARAAAALIRADRMVVGHAKARDEVIAMAVAAHKAELAQLREEVAALLREVDLAQARIPTGPTKRSGT